MDFGLWGLHTATTAPDELVQLARAAEFVGYESVWVGDHLALPNDMGEAATSPRLEALSTLTYLAAMTTTLRLAAGVIVVPQRHPLVLSKQVASLDLLSEGRLILGVGLGHVEPELTAFDVDMASRGEQADEWLDVMRRLWTGEPVTTTSDRLSFEGLVQAPPPQQQPHPPLVVGGASAAALRRAARIGDGWFGWLLTPEEAGERIAALHEACAGAGRDLDERPLEITVAGPGVPDRAAVDAYADAGVHRLVVGPDPGDPYPAFIATSAERFWA